MCLEVFVYATVVRCGVQCMVRFWILVQLFSHPIFFASHPCIVTFIEFFHMNKSVRGISQMHTTRIFPNTYIRLTFSRFQQIYFVFFFEKFFHRNEMKTEENVWRTATNEEKWDIRRSSTFPFGILSFY